jgi:hypothetical protein
VRWADCNIIADADRCEAKYYADGCKFIAESFEIYAVWCNFASANEKWILID